MQYDGLSAKIGKCHGVIADGYPGSVDRCHGLNNVTGLCYCPKDSSPPWEG